MAPKHASRAMQPTAASSSKKSTLEQLKTSHQTAITTLEKTHAAEMQKMRDELDKFRAQSNTLDGVEAKIKAVEETLRECKKHATQKEQELYKTIQKKDEDRNQLAQVVEELKEEIDRCQVQLDEDATKQAEEKKAMKEEKVALKKAKAEAEKRADNMGSVITDLQNTITQQAQELKDLRANKGAADSEMVKKAEQAVMDKEKSEREIVATYKDLQTQILLYERQLKESRDSEETAKERLMDMDEEAAKAKKEAEIESEETQEVIKNLQDEIIEYKKLFEEQRGIQTATMEKLQHVVESAEEARLKAQTESTDRDQEVKNLQDTIVHLRHQLKKAHESESKHVEKLADMAEEAEKARIEAEREAKATRYVMENLQDQIQAMHHDIVDAQHRENDLKKEIAENATVSGLLGTTPDIDDETMSTSHDGELDNPKDNEPDVATVIGLHATTSDDNNESVTTSYGRPRKLSDPFTRPPASTTHISMENAISNGISEWDGKMTLEGTLESLRIQTEQLMEVHDDILAENQRMASRINHSRKTTPSNE